MLDIMLDKQNFDQSSNGRTLATIFHPPENGSIYSWGDGKKGQLGHGGRELKVQPTPKCGQTFCPCPTNTVEL